MEDDSLAEIESEIELDNQIMDAEIPAQQDLRAAPNIPRVIRATKHSKGNC
jgi:hypothetical protein